MYHKPIGVCVRNKFLSLTVRNKFLSQKIKKKKKLLLVFISVSYFNKRNDPSAGSPTDALLRLLFPLDHTVRVHSYRTQSEDRVPVLYTHRIVHR